MGFGRARGRNVGLRLRAIRAPTAVIARSKATRQSSLSFPFPRGHGLLRAACHRARIRDPLARNLGNTFADAASRAVFYGPKRVLDKTEHDCKTTPQTKITEEAMNIERLQL